ncbi:MAG: DUF1156 domain-containing protein [bacterium]|nr:DUF1156 domain-containing protein [bacterium]
MSSEDQGSPGEARRLLIEEWLPVAELGIESVRESTPIPGQFPKLKTLHVWWARRPLVASAGAVLAGLLPAWSPELARRFPGRAELATEEAYRKWFLELCGILGDPVAARKRIHAATEAGIRLGAAAYGYKQAFKNNPGDPQIGLLHEVLRTTWGSLPTVLDPTAGGGSIPFAATRLRLPTTANDLNPVAAAVVRAGVEFPDHFGTDLLPDLEHWGAVLVERLNGRLARFFVLPDRSDNNSYIFARTVACPRTGKLVPLVGDWSLRRGEAPVAVRLVTWRDGRELEAPAFEITTGDDIDFDPKGEATWNRGKGTSPWDGLAIDSGYIKAEAQAGRMGEVLYAVAIRTPKGRGFRAPTEVDLEALAAAEAELQRLLPDWERDDVLPNERIPDGNKTREPHNYGMPRWRDMCTPRQLLVHGSFTEEYRRLIPEVRAAITVPQRADAVLALLAMMQAKALDWNSRVCVWDVSRQKIGHTFTMHAFPFKNTFAEFEAGTELFAWTLKQLLDAYGEIARLLGGDSGPRQTLTGDSRRPAAAADAAPAGDTDVRPTLTGHTDDRTTPARDTDDPNPVASDTADQRPVAKYTHDLPALASDTDARPARAGGTDDLLALSGGSSPTGSPSADAAARTVSVTCANAGNLARLADGSVALVCIDPPYYDNVMYAELSDFFYVWEKRTLGRLWPELFAAEFTNKHDEAVANKARFAAAGRRAKGLADADYTNKMAAIFSECRRVLRPDGAMVVMFTHKRAEAWDSLGAALLQAGFSIGASWPVHTESEQSLHIARQNAVKSTIFLACRPRPARASGDRVYLDDIEPDIRAAAAAALERSYAAGLSGVDLLLCTYGPALSELSKHWPVYAAEADADGASRLLRPEEALDVARAEVTRRLRGALAGREIDFDPMTDFAVIAWSTFGARKFPYDEARRLALATGGLEIRELERHRVLAASKGAVELLEPRQRLRRGAGANLGGVDPDAASFGVLLDAVHTALWITSEDGPGAAKRWLDSRGLGGDHRFETCLQALVRAVPRSRTRGGWNVPEAELVDRLVSAYYPGIEVPSDDVTELVEKQTVFDYVSTP